jgi:Leucine-rich repeat (LRR) protein
MISVLSNIIQAVEDGKIELDNIQNLKIFEIDLSNRGLTILPDLTIYPNLKKLNCSFNQLISLNGIPDWVEEIDCSSNRLSQLPEVLPSQLRKFNCFLNSISELPSKLPNGLIYLNCMSNWLTKVPDDILPSSLLYFNCADNKLETIPLLPDGLKYLDYSYNYLTYSPNIPTSVKIIYCKNALAVEKEYTII